MQCNAKAKSTGQRCKREAVPGSEKCYYHGGASRRGIASPSFKNGKHSKYLPTRMQERYHEALADNDLLNLSAEIAILDARLADLLQTADNGATGELYTDLLETVENLGVAIRTGNSAGFSHWLAEQRRLLEAAQHDHKAWNEAQSVIQQRRALVESERKRRVQAEQTLQVNEALAFADALLLSVREVISDPDQLTRIQAAFARLVRAKDQQRIDSES